MVAPARPSQRGCGGKEESENPSEQVGDLKSRRKGEGGETLGPIKVAGSVNSTVESYPSPTDSCRLLGGVPTPEGPVYGMSDG